MNEANIGFSDIRGILSGCIEKSYPFAVWRKPETTKTFFLFSTGKSPVFRSIDFQELGPGFVMAPFEHENEGPVFLEADFISSVHNDKLDTPWINAPHDLKDFLAGFDASSLQPVELKIDASASEKEETDYLLKVSEVVFAIRNAEVEKVVLSRKKHLGAVSGDDFFDIFKRLESAYPSAFVSMTWLPWKNQIWVGATPETLVEQTPEGLFKTMALAGTQYAFGPDGSPIKPAEALWTQKEIEEQALVCRYIINCFKKIRVREYREEGPRTLRAGNLLHLSTLYSINTREISFPQLSSVMLDLLHPTSAVCGMPKARSLALIHDHEDYDREFYSGYLGPVNIEGGSHLFVNLRTMKIENKEVYSYAGGGITTDSDPRKEWRETELKLETILQSFR